MERRKGSFIGVAKAGIKKKTPPKRKRFFLS